MPSPLASITSISGKRYLDTKIWGPDMLLRTEMSLRLDTAGY